MLDSRQVAQNLPLRRRCLFLRDAAFLAYAFNDASKSVQLLHVFLRDEYIPSLVRFAEVDKGSEDLWSPLLTSANVVLQDLEKGSFTEKVFLVHWDEFLESGLCFLDLLFPPSGGQEHALVRLQTVVRDAMTRTILLFYEDGTAFYQREKAAQLVDEDVVGLNKAKQAALTFSITAPVSADVYDLFTAE